MVIKITPKQSKRINALVRKLCCNYVDGNCLLLDDGEEYACVQCISRYGIYCNYSFSAPQLLLHNSTPEQNAYRHSLVLRTFAVAPRLLFPWTFSLERAFGQAETALLRPACFAYVISIVSLLFLFDRTGIAQDLIRPYLKSNL